jgi:hypothetical protein
MQCQSMGVSIPYRPLNFDTVKHWRCYLEGCSQFYVMTHHDMLRHLLRQPNHRLNKRQPRYVRDLRPFVVTVALAYRKDTMNEADHP